MIKFLTDRHTIDIILWIGSSLILGAYLYISWLNPTKKNQLVGYQIANLIGSFCYIYGMFVLGVFQSVTLNIIWAFIGFVGLIKLFKK